MPRLCYYLLDRQHQALRLVLWCQRERGRIFTESPLLSLKNKPGDARLVFSASCPSDIAAGVGRLSAVDERRCWRAIP
jgi:hypothetical protein